VRFLESQLDEDASTSSFGVLLRSRVFAPGIELLNDQNTTLPDKPHIRKQAGTSGAIGIGLQVLVLATAPIARIRRGNSPLKFHFWVKLQRNQIRLILVQHVVEMTLRRCLRSTTKMLRPMQQSKKLESIS